MENGELKMENGVFWKWRVPFLSLRNGGNTVAVGEAIQTGEALALDCFASLAMTESVVIASHEAAKQSRRGRPFGARRGLRLFKNVKS
jgi:hypothetical protein